MKARSKTNVGTLAIANIRRGGGTQIRVALDEDTVQEYTALIKAGFKFPPVGVYQDGPLQQDTAFWLWDGFHRVEAYSRAGVERIQAEFRMGTRRDAIRAACGANADHGLKRSNADKRRAVETFLADPEWQQWSDGAIAKEARVSRQTVSNMRGELAILPVEQQRVIGLDGRERPRPVKDSASGQPTPVLPPAGNPTAEGEEGAGAMERPERLAAPAPDEPRDRLINVERMLRDAQAEIGPLIAKGDALNVLVALNEALAVVRRALAPAPAPAARSLCKGCGGVNCGAICLYSREALGEQESGDPGNPALRAALAPASAPLSPEGRAEFARVLVEERLLTSADAPRVVSAGWPEPKAAPRRGPHVRVILETPSGDVSFEDVSQAGPADAG